MGPTGQPNNQPTNQQTNQPTNRPWQDQGSLLPAYKDILAPQIRVLIFNGDVDACVPYNGNAWWTASLDLPEARPFRAWSVDKQVAGYVTSYVSDSDYKTKGLTFATVKGSGHMVPQFRPKQALAMFSRFIGGTPLDVDV